MRKKVLVVMSLMMVAAMLAACGGQASTAPAVVTQIVEGSPVVVTATPAPETPMEFTSKDPTTWTEVTFGDPETLDPAFDYETGGGGVLMNVYDTLIWYDKDSAAKFVPQLATEVPSLENGGISADGLTVTFKIRPGVKFHDGSDLTPSDVAYTFQRGILQGGTASPQWLFTEPLLGVGTYDIAEVVDSTGALDDDKEGIKAADPATLKAACEKVTAAIVPDDTAGTVTFHLAQAWAPFISTFTGSWGSIQSKAWVSSNGGWDGSCDTWQNYYGVVAEDLNKTALGTSAMGTGPYKLDHWTPQEEIVMTANDNYWRTEPIWEGGPSGTPALKKVILKNVTEFSTRLAMGQAGDADQVVVGSSADWPIMDQMVGEECEEGYVNCKPVGDGKGAFRLIRNDGISARTDVYMSFSVNTDGGNNFIGSGKLDGNGIPANFFSDIHVRHAFSYCFNYETYLNDVLQGEGIRSKSVIFPGMVGYDDNAPSYDYDPEKCKSELEASTWKQNADGTYTPDEKGDLKVSDIGFRLTMAYNTGNTARQTIGQILQSELSAINDKYIVEVTGLPWASFLQNQRAKKLPIFTVGWQSDIFDPHNWVQPYTTGTYGSRQNMPADILAKFEDINTRGVSEVDPDKRKAIYAEFNQLYYDVDPGILLYVAGGHHYEPRYVSGWYNNPMYADNWFYALSKK